MLATVSTPSTAAVTTAEIQLPAGLIGLSELKRFELISETESLPFRRLVSVDSPDVEFVVVEPEGIVPDYEVQVADEDAEDLEITAEAGNPQILNILTIRSMDPQKVTANLVAPIIVNRSTGNGKQVLLSNYKQYSTDYLLIDEA